MADTNPQLDLNDLNAATRAASQLGLPLVRLTAHDVAPQALKFIDEKFARQYRLIPFKYDEAKKALTIAIADPSLLSQPAPDFLQTLKADSYTLELQVTPASDFEAALAAYGQVASSRVVAQRSDNQTVRQPASDQKSSVKTPTTDYRLPTMKPAQSAAPILPTTQSPQPPTTPPPDTVPGSVYSPNVPSVKLAGKTIPPEVLERFPEDVATKYQMVVFELSKDGTVASVAAVNPADRRVREILKFVEERNDIRIQLYMTDKASLQSALSQYPSTGSQPAPAVPLPSNEKLKTKNEKPSVKLTSELTSLPTPPQAAPVPLKMATADKLKAAAVQPVAAPPPPPKISSAGPVQPGIKVGGATPAAPNLGEPIQTPSQYQQAVTRNSATPPSTQQPVTQINATDIQTPAGEAGQTSTAPVLEINVEERNLDTILGGVLTQSSQLEEVVKSGMIPRIVAGFISYAVALNASDIHIEAAREYVRLRYRIDGVLQEIVRMPATMLAPIVSRIKILAKLKIDESRIPQDGRFDVSVSGHEIDLRVSTLPTVFGEKVVLRILDKSSGIKKLEELGIEGTNLERLREVIRDPYGIILVTGPTGSGKTSTLYAMLNELNTQDVNIVTLEDPVEYQLEGINQTQVRPNINFGFADGLRSILRQDPNIIMVGEIRDKETASLATQAALTGHLVLSTLHTNDAAGAIPRMLDMGIEPFLLASSIKAVIGQRLVRRLVPDSKVQAPVPPEMLEAVKTELGRGKSPEAAQAAAAQLAFFGSGSTGQGYRGRVGIYEVLSMSPAIADLTLKKAVASKLAETGLAEGMVTMRQDGIIKALQGITSLDEVLQATEEK